MSAELIILIVLIVVVTDLVTLPPILLNPERKELNQHVRASMRGLTFVQLRDGYTHYSLLGPENAPVVVMIHGGITPFCLAWRFNYTALMDAGFRVLQYDLYGRGLSDRPKLPNNGDLFDGQLLELLDALDIESPVDLVGVSMGGGIALNFADRHPERVRRFALIAPWVLMEQEPAPPQMRFLRTPLLAEWVMCVLGQRMLIGSIPKLLPDCPDLWADVESVYREQMSYKGFRFSLLSTLREYPCRGMGEILPRIARQRRAAALIWGDRDTTAPFHPFHDRVMALVPWLEDHVIQGGDHLINFTQADKVNPILVELFSRQEA